MNTVQDKVFISSYKIYFADTDAAGVVHHSRYITWLEAARIDFLEAINYSYVDLQKEKHGFSPIHIDIKYLKALRFGDHFDIHTRVTHIGKASVTFHSEFVSKSQTICTATQKLASINEATWKVQRVPEEFIIKVQNSSRHI